ncbi:MAG: hypothetical protein PWQ09_1422 [Candidatus Cloacimonadota bacterium]|jgi:hypothetical protein|nr:hypothetical protein [Candidatus Cloacimonadota bacterium]
MTKEEQQKEIGQIILSAAEKVYKKGMTKEQLAEELFPGMVYEKLPDWARRLIIALLKWLIGEL